MAALKFYTDLMSQPCRAIYIFLRMNNIPHEQKDVALRKGEHMTEDFKQINPFQKVPSIDDNGFKLTESIASMQYLHSTRRIANHWYPAETQQRARVDEYMCWQHANTRFNCSMLFRAKVLEPKMTGKPLNEKRVQNFRESVQQTLQYIEDVFLKDGPYLCSCNDVSIADLLCACELIQPLAADEHILQNRPKLQAYMDRVKQRLQPHFDGAHKYIYRLMDTSNSKL